MRIFKIFSIAIAAIIGLCVVAVGAVWVLNPFAPIVVVSDPGQTGERITDNGLFANYYPVAGDGQHPAILLLGGSEGGIGTGMSRMAVTLQDEGYAVLSLSYFGAPEQPGKLELVPLELFDQAIDWIKSQSNIDGDRLAVIGASKGAEAALIVATRHPELRMVVAGMPSSVAWQGIDFNVLNYIFNPPNGSWSLNEEPIPFVPYVKEFANGPFELYVKSLAEKSNYPDAIIPIEATRATVFLVCGKDDALWPSCEMAEQIKMRAVERQGPEVTVLAYDDAGHGGFGVPVEPTNPNFGNLAGLGGTAHGNNAARIDGWARMLEHLESALKPGSDS